MTPETLKKRRDYLACAKGRKWSGAGFLLQARQRRQDEPAHGLRVGFTCSKKVGNAVTRNRAKRRLRALAAEVLSAEGRNGWDYVLVGKAGGTVTRAFMAMKTDLAQALAKVHADRRP